MFRNIFLQGVILVLVFNVFSWLREASMLSDNLLSSSKIHQVPTLSISADDQTTMALSAQDKTTVLYFFAPWCSVCHMSIENLQSVYLKNPNIEVIAVALDFDNKQAVLEFTQQHQLTFPVVLGNAQVKSDFKIKGYPSYYVLDQDNNITSKSLGYSTELGLYLRTL